MKWLFYKKETSTRGVVLLIYNVEPDDMSMYDGCIKISNLKEPEDKDGMISSLYVNPNTEEYWYEYNQRELTKEELQGQKIQELENALLEISTLQAIKDLENEQAIMELTMMIGGM